MKLPFVFVLLLLLALPAPSDAQTNLASTNAVRSFPTRGLVREKPADGKTLVVRHEEIPGYMPKMTMELTVKNTSELKTISEGDLITFNLVVNADDHYIDQIRRIGVSKETNAPVAAPAQSHLSELGPGDAMPDVELLDENGKQTRLSDFRGNAVAFTFIFSRCPLPDYCPRMNKHFLSAREILLQNKSGATNWQFLSISFDAEFDKPAVLKGYGNLYRSGNNDRWLFAAIAPEVLAEIGPRLDFRFSREAGGFSHNLRTVVLDSKGRIFKQFDNNLWSAEDLAKAITTAAEVR
ncbi:MAG: SCO family protein [Verrucomicrobia bacterium]|nr:SCO family protein [Verrucomicrobiota bacterium]